MSRDNLEPTDRELDERWLAVGRAIRQRSAASFTLRLLAMEAFEWPDATVVAGPKAVQ